VHYARGVQIQAWLKRQHRVRSEVLLAIGLGMSGVGLVANNVQLGRVLLSVGSILITIAVVLWVYATAD
jgi:hypothetical protein